MKIKTLYKRELTLRLLIKWYFDKINSRLGLKKDEDWNQPVNQIFLPIPCPRTLIHGFWYSVFPDLYGCISYLRNKRNEINEKLKSIEENV